MVLFKTTDLTDLVTQLNRYVAQNATDLSKLKNSAAPALAPTSPSGVSVNTIPQATAVGGVAVKTGSDQIDRADLNTQLVTLTGQINSVRDTLNTLLNSLRTVK